MKNLPVKHAGTHTRAGKALRERRPSLERESKVILNLGR